MKRSDLKGGCYVLDGVFDTPGPFIPVIGDAFGAKHVSQMALKLNGPSGVMQFGAADVILFVIEGRGSADIGGKTFALQPRSGLYLRPGEALQITPEGEILGLLTVCPEAPAFTVLKTMPACFDNTCPERLATIDPAKKEAMGERFFQVLVSKHMGSRNITQFIGEIPKSKAPSHHHLYEETIFILGGEGYMWTGNKKAPVKPGSVIFLPAKQEHSLECTSDAGLQVAGHFYPAGSPAENY